MGKSGEREKWGLERSGEKGEHGENEEKSGEIRIPDEWKDIPIQAYIDDGYRPRVKTLRGKKYISLKKGNREIGLGPFTEEKWAIITSIAPGSTKNQPKGGKIDEDQYVQASIRGVAKGEGYLEELKNMIRAQINRTRELSEFCYNLGLGILTAALSRSGIGIEEFRKIAMEEGSLKNALYRAAETAFKALEYYNLDAVRKLEDERDEARAAYSLVAAQLKNLMKNLDPKFRLEKMIYTYLLSGNVDPNVLTSLIDKWLSMEIAKVREEVVKYG